MKALLCLLLISCSASLAPAADAPSFAGKWQLYIEVGGTSAENLCTFTQTGNDLGGSCETRGGEIAVVGKVDNNKVTFTYKAQSAEGVFTVVFNGTLNLTTGITRITGAVNVEEVGIQGTFTANQAK